MRRWLLLPVALLFLAAGCSQSSAPTQQVQENPFDQEFGGISTSSEAPGFGNTDLVSAATTDEVDPSDPLAASIQSGGEPEYEGPPRFLALRVIWGQMHYDSTSTTPTIWDGKLSVTPGRIGVARVIRFEPATDYVLPRTDSSVVAWVSQTTVHNDGLLCLIGLPRPERPDSSRDSSWVDSLPDDTMPPPPPPDVVVKFETGPLTIEFSLAELLSLDTVISVDERGNAVMFSGMLIEPELGACPRGFLGGKWTMNEEGTGGEFEGRWASDHGDLKGYVRGIFGINSKGHRVFFGKYIDENGNFEGRMRGVWNPHSHHPETGPFKGVFYSPSGEPAGRLHGRWTVDDEDGGGSFQGVWKTHCPGGDNGARGWAKWDDENFDDRQDGNGHRNNGGKQP